MVLGFVIDLLKLLTFIDHTVAGFCPFGLLSLSYGSRWFSTCIFGRGSFFFFAALILLGSWILALVMVYGLLSSHFSGY